MNCKRTKKNIKFGKEKRNCHIKGTSMPTLLEKSANDDQIEMRIKRIITNMTKFDNYSRKHICEVKEEFTGQVQLFYPLYGRWFKYLCFMNRVYSN